MSTQDKADTETKAPEALKEEVQQRVEKHKDLLLLSEGKDIVAVLGITGSGKSTTLNWLAGKELIVGKYGKIMLADETDKSAMEIGNSYGAMTDRPHYIEINGHVFFDLPGFRDTGGMACDLVNAAFIKAILEGAKSVRVMFFASKDEVTASRGELLKTLLAGVKQMFDEDEEILLDSSLLVITKSDLPDLDSLKGFLKEGGVAPQYYALMSKYWINRDALFQLRKPDGGKICFEGKEKILSALSCPGHKINHVNVSALYPDGVDAELGKIFGSIFDKALSSFLPKPEEDLLSSLLCAHRFVKGDPESDGYCGEFWNQFQSHLETIDSVFYLKPLSEKAFGDTFERFQTSKFGEVREIARQWELKAEILSSKIQSEMASRIRVICDEQEKQLRERFSCDNVKDVKSGEEQLEFLKKALTDDYCSMFLAAVRDDSGLEEIVDKDPDFNGALLHDIIDTFSTQDLEKIGERMKEFIQRSITIVESSINTIKLNEAISKSTKDIADLTAQAKKDREENEKLSKIIEKMNADAAEQKKQLEELQKQLEQSRLDAAKWEKISSVITGISSITGKIPDFIDSVDKIRQRRKNDSQKGQTNQQSSSSSSSTFSSTVSSEGGKDTVSHGETTSSKPNPISSSQSSTPSKQSSTPPKKSSAPPKKSSAPPKKSSAPPKKSSAPLKQTPAPKPPPKPQTKKYTVKQGDCVSRILEREVGGPWKSHESEFRKLNPGVKDIDKIYVGQTLVLPKK